MDSIKDMTKDTRKTGWETSRFCKAGSFDQVLLTFNNTTSGVVYKLPSWPDGWLLLLLYWYMFTLLTRQHSLQGGGGRGEGGAHFTSYKNWVGGSYTQSHKEHSGICGYIQGVP